VIKPGDLIGADRAPSYWVMDPRDAHLPIMSRRRIGGFAAGDNTFLVIARLSLDNLGLIPGMSSAMRNRSELLIMLCNQTGQIVFRWHEMKHE
jgi:hypothetical protein